MLPALIVIMAGCSLEKQSGFNRNMQNLTAHYNILFNAKEILRQKQEAYAAAFIDNYNEVLSVYPDTIAQTATPDKDLEEAILKANKIINIKEQSHYLGDAYLVLGKAYYLEGNYFNANEYCGYVIRSFPKREDLKQDALVWQARSLLYLDQLKQAKQALDTAIQNINPKENITADVYAAKLQYDINTQDYADGEEMAIQALKYVSGQEKRLRLTFILGQLQELNKKNNDAIISYTKIVKSNASFEMAFNASLNRIRIEDIKEGIKLSKTERLLSLLRNPNNKEFKDQIYYHVAELQLANKNIDGAIKNYKLSVRSSLKNQNQKGLSYLRLAEVYFKNKADYLGSKKYYDSTLTTLPINYPGYKAIQKKGNNLQVLADRMQMITREDTLQALAKMDETTRLAVIDRMVNDQILQQQATANAAIANAPANAASTQVNQGSGGSSFYFYNSNAVSQGYNDFKRVWGNRKLTDNWRLSTRSNNATTEIPTSDSVDPFGEPSPGKTTVKAGNYRAALLKDLPLTPQQLSQSNLRIYNAYIDLANFYRDVLSDKKEAIATYETVLRRFPDDPNKPAIYYNLYRLYSDIDLAKSEMYKNRLIKEYPETPFAKVIIDPDYTKKLDNEDNQFTNAYNKVFDLYTHKKYTEVITEVPALLKQYPRNKYSAQLYYLKTIAEGHNEKVTPFKDSLQQIVKLFPLDKLVTPLVNQHLAFISANETEMQSRPVVLADDNPQEIPFTLTSALKKQTAYHKNVQPFENAPKPEVKPQVPQPVVPTPAPVQAPISAQTLTANAPAQPTISSNLSTVTIKKTEIISSIFSLRDSTNYYFIVNVSTATTNLASSRFGIGQFDRANYAGKGIRHLVKPIGDDAQLIYVGKFASLEDVKKYARQIIPIMPDIMKVPKDKYSFFIITQENLDKLADRKTLDSYIDYYQKNY